MAKAKFVALTSFDLGHRIIAAGDTLFSIEAASAADIHFFRSRLSWSAFRVIVEEEAPAAPAAPAVETTSPEAATADAEATTEGANEAPSGEPAAKGAGKAKRKG